MARSKAEEDLLVAKRYFFAGFLGLPLLWLLLAANFWKASRREGAPSALRFYVNGSLVGAAVVLTGLAVWIGIFQANWVEWGEFGRNLLVVPIDPPDSW